MNDKADVTLKERKISIGNCNLKIDKRSDIYIDSSTFEGLRKNLYNVLYKNGIFFYVVNGKTMLSANGIDWPKTGQGKIDALLNKIAEMYEEKEKREDEIKRADFITRLRYLFTGVLSCEK